MRRQQVRFVVLLGAISIIGIITVQAYFLFQAWNIREKQLTQSLVIALKTVAEKISQAQPDGSPLWESGQATDFKLFCSGREYRD